MRTFLWLVSLCFLLACEDEGKPYVPPPEPPTDVSFADDVQPIFNDWCVACHSGDEPQGGMDLAEGNAYDSLVGVNSPVLLFPRVDPGSSANSVLYCKISGTDCGSRMPLGGMLPEEDILTIQVWIDEGAANN